MSRYEFLHFLNETILYLLSKNIKANAIIFFLEAGLQRWKIANSVVVHTEKSFLNLIKSTRNQIVFTIFRLIWIQMDVRLDPNQSENGKYNLISG